MKPVFADTCYYVALCNPRDNWHIPAVKAGEACKARVVTTEYILLELGNSLSSPALRSTFLKLESLIRNDEFTTLVPASTTLYEAGLELFRSRPDKSWSLTDCITFTVMTNRNITDTLSCDQHFQQAGFNLLMKE